MVSPAALSARDSGTCATARRPITSRTVNCAVDFCYSGDACRSSCDWSSTITYLLLLPDLERFSGSVSCPGRPCSLRTNLLLLPPRLRLARHCDSKRGSAVTRVNDDQSTDFVTEAIRPFKISCSGPGWNAWARARPRPSWQLAPAYRCACRCSCNCRRGPFPNCPQQRTQAAPMYDQHLS